MDWLVSLHWVPRQTGHFGPLLNEHIIGNVSGCFNHSYTFHPYEWDGDDDDDDDGDDDDDDTNDDDDDDDSK